MCVVLVCVCVCVCVCVHVSVCKRELPMGAGGRNGAMVSGDGSADTSRRKQPNIQIKVCRRNTRTSCPRVSPLLCVLEREREEGRKEGTSEKN